MSKDIHKWTDGRYTLMFDEHTFFVWDNENDERMTALNVTEKLNEQQSTIKQLEFDKAIAEDYANIFEKENVKLRKQIDEQQATIRKLQDLCGESDGENMKLRIKNKQLEQEKEKLIAKVDFLERVIDGDINERETNRNYFSKKSAELD